MKTKLVLIVASLAVAGCGHISPGSVGEYKSSMGVAPLWKFDKEFRGIKATDKTLRADEGRVTLQIFNFVWEASGKDVLLTNPSK